MHIAQCRNLPLCPSLMRAFCASRFWPSGFLAPVRECAGVLWPALKIDETRKSRIRSSREIASACCRGAWKFSVTELSLCAFQACARWNPDTPTSSLISRRAEEMVSAHSNFSIRHPRFLPIHPDSRRTGSTRAWDMQIRVRERTRQVLFDNDYSGIFNGAYSRKNKYCIAKRMLFFFKYKYIT